MAVIGVVAALGLVLVVMAAWSAADQPVRWRDVGFTVTSPERVAGTFDVTMEPGRSARCSIQALDSSYGQVGVRAVEVPADSARTQRMTVDVATTSMAVTVVVQECHLT